jgi:cell division protein ZapB
MSESLLLSSAYRCGGSAGGFSTDGLNDLCFPFNCADVKTGTGTNTRDCKQPRMRPYNKPFATPQGAMSKTQELADRVERLLLRHEELKRTNELLEQQLAALTHERDNLRSRLNAARSRIDALLERLPVDAPVGGRAEGDSP